MLRFALLPILAVFVCCAGDFSDRSFGAIASPAPLPPGPLSSWVSRGFSLPCREPADNYGPSAHSVFAPDGEAFVAFTDAYLVSAGAFAGDAAKWPLDDPALVAARAARVFDARGAAPPIPFPHVARVDVPVNSTVAVFGDLHGSFHSLLRTLWAHADAGRLDPSTLLVSPGVFFVFLGDYVDRGVNGVETIALLLALKSANPASVFLARGNHEDVLLNDGPAGGFAEELAVKFPHSQLEHVSAAVQRVYESLPQAIFLGAKLDAVDGLGGGQDGSAVEWGHGGRHIQMCHGGLEVGFNPSALLASVAAETASGARVGFALIHGFSRGAWLKTLKTENLTLAKKIPPAVTQQLHDVGIGKADPPRPPRARGLHAEGITAHEGASLVDSIGDTHASFLDAAADDDSVWLSSTRDARVVAASAWHDGDGMSGVGWPTVPMGTNPASGYMWADFLVSPAAAAVYSQGRGIAWGLPVTDAVLRSSALVGVLRAHQHNNAPGTGPMLSHILRDGGAHVSWGGAGGVATLLSGAHVPGLDFDKDAHSLLRVPGIAPVTWTLDLCASTPGFPAAAQTELDALEDGPGGDGIFGRSRSAASPEHEACSVHRSFDCKSTGWAAID